MIVVPERVPQELVLLVRREFGDRSVCTRARVGDEVHFQILVPAGCLGSARTFRATMRMAQREACRRVGMLPSPRSVAPPAGPIQY